MLIQQCDRCNKKGKKLYCNSCVKSPDYFDVYKYNNRNIFVKGELIVSVKACTWHDAIEQVKNNLFHKQIRNENLTINCEKDFAYLEQNSAVTPIKEPLEDLLTYKIYLNKERNESSLLEYQNFWDLTFNNSNQST
jgi:hypothetical protein